MSAQKHFGPFSGAQLTVIVCAAILAPTALYAITFTSVVVTDPLTGKQAAVDAGRRLYTYDPIAGYANNPFNLVQFSGGCSGSTSTTIYTVPAGKALILKAGTLAYLNGAAGGGNYAFFYDFDGTGYSFVTGYIDTNTAGVHYTDLGSGWFFHAGDSVTCLSTASTLYSFQGYLAPSNAVPALGTPEGAAQMVSRPVGPL